MIEQGLYQFLVNEPTVSNIVGNRVYPAGRMAEGVLTSLTPVIVFSKVTITPIDSLSGDNVTESALWQFDCYSVYPDIYTAIALASAVRSLLVPKSDASGTTRTTSYTLPGGTVILAARIHNDRDFAPSDADSARFCRRMLEVHFTYVP